MSIFDFVPKGYKLREVQKKVLKDIEDNWQEYDAFVIDAPVAFGKSLLSIIIANWQKSKNQSTGILTPRALLQDQYSKDFPHLPSLKGKDRYSCNTKGYKSCSDFYDVAEYYCCNDCPYKTAVDAVTSSSTAIFNFHSHLFGGMVRESYKDVLIIDEAHNLISMLSEIYSVTIWKHKDKYPSDTHTKDDIIEWLSDQILELNTHIRQARAIYGEFEKMPAGIKKLTKERTRKKSKYEMIRSGLLVPQELFHIAKTEKHYGKPIRGKHQVMECIEVRPITLKTVPHQMWPDSHVKKLILMSATIYDKDIERIGISRKRVKHIKSDSPIPSNNRQIIIDGLGHMSYNKKDKAIKPISDAILRLADKYKGKGLIHITYSTANDFKKHLKGKRFIWHTSENREEMYNKFINSTGNEILMACGMSEGIDLAGPDYEWQVIAKVVFPSLADKLQQYFVAKEKLIYDLEVVRTLVQQSGRICRTPTDTGTTYILDSCFKDFYIQNYKLFPSYFVDAMKWKKLI